MNLLNKLFNTDCSKKLIELQRENDDLKTKILEQQDQINKTNSYYKKKISGPYTTKNSRRFSLLSSLMPWNEMRGNDMTYSSRSAMFALLSSLITIPRVKFGYNIGRTSIMA